MPGAPARKRKKSSRNSGLQKRVPLVVVVLAVAAAAVWYFFGARNSGEDVTIEARLVEMAAERGVSSDAVAADDPIRKIDGVFVRTWRFEFPNRAARDGFLGDLQIEGAARHAELTFPEELSAQLIRLRMDFGGEAFDLILAVNEAVFGIPMQVSGNLKRVAPTPLRAGAITGLIAVMSVATWKLRGLTSENFPRLVSFLRDTGWFAWSLLG